MKAMLMLLLIAFAVLLCLAACSNDPADTAVTAPATSATASIVTSAITTAPATNAVTTAPVTTEAPGAHVPTVGGRSLSQFTIVATEQNAVDATLLSDLLFAAYGVRLSVATEACGAAITLATDADLMINVCEIAPDENGIRATGYGKNGTYLAALAVRDLLATAAAESGDLSLPAKRTVGVSKYLDERTAAMFYYDGTPDEFYMGELNVAFLGGSLTQGKTAWTGPVTAALAGLYPNATINTLNAGIGATDSELGAARFEKDVLSKMTPDILFIDYAVNDGGYTTEDSTAIIENGVYMESIINQCKALPNPPIIIFLYFPTGKRLGAGTEAWENGVALKERLAENYGIASVNVWEHFEGLYLEQCRQHPGMSYDEFLTQYYAPTDMTHPMDAGFAEFGKAITKAILSDPLCYLQNRQNFAPCFTEYEDVANLSYTLIPAGGDGYTTEGSISHYTSEAYASTDPRYIPAVRISPTQLAAGVMQSDDGTPFSVTVVTAAKYLKLYGISAPAGMKVDILVDGECVGTVDTYRASTYLYIGGAKISDDGLTHTVVIRPATDNPPENTVFRFGYIVLGE